VSYNENVRQYKRTDKSKKMNMQYPVIIKNGNRDFDLWLGMGQRVGGTTKGSLERYANTLGVTKVGYVDSTPKPSKSCYQNPFGRWE